MPSDLRAPAVRHDAAQNKPWHSHCDILFKGGPQHAPAMRKPFKDKALRQKRAKKWRQTLPTGSNLPGGERTR